MEFSELELHPDLKRGISEAGYTTCMPVQEQVLQNAFGGQDLYVQSQTGTGKTAAYLIVIFQRLVTEPFLHGKKALIMVPTRELAVQVEEEAAKLAKYLPLKTGSFYGGVGYGPQVKALKENAQILVGTPGRVLDLNQSGQMNLMDIGFLVIDEADRMFDMGFYPDLRKLIQVVPPADRRQTMLFSATLNSWVKNLAWEYTKEPYEIAIEPETVTVEEVEQTLYHTSSDEKMKLLMGILSRESPESVIIFCNTKRYAEIVAKRMRLNGYETEFIMGDLPQIKRLKIIDDIKDGKLRYLVATDVAARGLDIEGLSMVVNYDLPNEAENYVHRIGRTARAGKTGKAVSFCSEQDVYELPAIERYIGGKIPSQNVTADLLGDDKSDGVRIHTDFYEDGPRDRDRGGRRGRSSPGGRGGRQEGRRGERSGAPRQGGRGPERGDDRRGGRPPARQERPHGKPMEPRPDLSKMTQEERLEYYKNKYGERVRPASETQQARRQPKAPRQGKPEQKNQRPKQQGIPPKGMPKDRDENRAETREGGGKRRRRRGGKPSGQQGDRQQATSRQAKAHEKKQGILSKILGIFKKK
jgi:ATP-dependent RNA helicase RhlB